MAAVRNPQKALFDVLCTRRRGTMCEIARFSCIVPQGCGRSISPMSQEWLVSAVFEIGALPRYGLKTFASAVGAHCCGTTARKALNRRIVPQMACCARGRAWRKGYTSRARGASLVLAVRDCERGMCAVRVGCCASSVTRYVWWSRRRLSPVMMKRSARALAGFGGGTTHRCTA